jgi:hypothetical protein
LISLQPDVYLLVYAGAMAAAAWSPKRVIAKMGT